MEGSSALAPAAGEAASSTCFQKGSSRGPAAHPPGLGIPGPGLGFHTLPLPEEVQVTWCELGQEQQCSQSQQKELHGWKWPKVRLQVQGDRKANGAGLRPPRLEVPLFSRTMSAARALSRPRLWPPRCPSPGSAATHSELARLLWSFGQPWCGGVGWGGVGGKGPARG